MTGPATEARAVLAKGSHSFSFAARFLPAPVCDDAAHVYAFCRHVDDVADDADVPEDLRLVALWSLRQQVLGRAAPGAEVCGLLEVHDRRGLELGAALALIEGCTTDVTEVRLPDDDALLRYCYRVASTVGLLMCGVLEVRDPKALPFAIDLGIAMQLTNICRDVAEDARMGRVYLPERRLRAVGSSSALLVAGTAEAGAVASVVRDLLHLADTYYASAWRGMAYLPVRARLAIYVAARVYRRIGVDLLAAGGDALAGRTVVPWRSKAVEALRAIGQFLTSLFQGGPDSVHHESGLHRALVGLPGAHRH